MIPIITIIILGSVLLVSTESAVPVVTVPQLGTAQGSLSYSSWTNRTIYQFQAIPYAQPPIGALRFKPPVKVVSWSGTLDASKPGVHCPQNNDRFVNLNNEDCLTLSVYTNSLDENRPVMVYIHGGWFFLGSASVYGPEYLLESDIVLVVIQYRLGPFGFLSTLSEKIPGNVGILDMIVALEWVQQNIRSFGGDNSKVTIFGESAGSAAVSTFLHSPLIRGRSAPLFHRAILQSGSIFSPWALCDNPLEGSLDIAKRLGCSTADIETCFEQASVSNLLQAFKAHRDDTIIKRGYPSVAGTTVVVGGPSEVFPVHPMHYLSNADRTVSVMGGTTSQDGLFLLSEICRLQPEKLNSLNNSHDLLIFVRLLLEKFGQTKYDGGLDGLSFSQHFLMKEAEEMKWKDLLLGLTDICGTHGIKAPTLVDMQVFSRVNPSNVFLYSFDYSNLWTKRNLSVEIPYEGFVHHAEDLIYLFPSDQLNEKDIRIAKTMVQLWTSFAIRGIPSAKDVTYWPPMDKLYGPYLTINERSESKNNYLNEFTASTLKFRTFGSGSSRVTFPSLLLCLALVVKLLL